MTLPKEQVEELFEPAVRSLLEPGERLAVSAFTVPGPSPMRVGFLGAVFQAVRGSGDLWMAVTDRRVVFVRSAFMTPKPKATAWVDARHAVRIAEVHGGERSGWDWFVYLRPDGAPVRMNFSVTWRDEFDEIVEELSHPPTAPEVDGWGSV